MPLKPKSEEQKSGSQGGFQGNIAFQQALKESQTKSRYDQNVAATKVTYKDMEEGKTVMLRPLGKYVTTTNSETGHSFLNFATDKIVVIDKNYQVVRVLEREGEFLPMVNCSHAVKQGLEEIMGDSRKILCLSEHELTVSKKTGNDYHRILRTVLVDPASNKFFDEAKA